MSEDIQPHGTMREILTTDIELKRVIIEMFRKIMKRQQLQISLISCGTLVIIIFAIAYFTKPTHIDTKVLEGLQIETTELHIERSQIKAERQQLEQVIAQIPIITQEARKRNTRQLDTIIDLLKSKGYEVIKKQRDTIHK